MNSNKPLPPKDIVNYPESLFKCHLVKIIMVQPEYINARTFRIQIYIFIEFSRFYYNGMYKLTYSDVARLFGVTVPIVDRAYQNAKKDLAEKSRPNGRPFTLSNEQIQKLSDWMKSNKEHLQIKKVKNFIANEVCSELDNKTYKNAINKAGHKTDVAESIDADIIVLRAASIIIIFG